MRVPAGNASPCIHWDALASPRTSHKPQSFSPATNPHGSPARPFPWTVGIRRNENLTADPRQAPTAIRQAGQVTLRLDENGTLHGAAVVNMKLETGIRWEDLRYLLQALCQS